MVIMESGTDEARIISLLQYLAVLNGDEKEEESDRLGSSTTMELTEERLEELEEIIGYKFKDRSLLVEALTDKTYKEGCKTYERLEYLGDTVLNSMVTCEQLELYPDMGPGDLTRLRAANVDTEKLARVALKLNLHKYLLHNKRLLQDQTQEFMDGLAKYPLHSFGMIDPPKVLADIVESTIGAIFVDSKSMDVTWKIVRVLLEPMITPATCKKNPVVRLMELCQKLRFTVRRCLSKWELTGEVEYIVADHAFVGRAQYKPKKLIAMNRAAEDAYKKIMGKRNLVSVDNAAG